MTIFRGSKQSTLPDGSPVVTQADLVEAIAEVQQAQISVENAFDIFNDTYLGAKDSDPIKDNNGDDLITGALYYNTTDQVTKVYDASAGVWSDLNLSAEGQQSIDSVIGISDEVITVAGIDSDVTAVSGVSSDVSVVAANLSDLSNFSDVYYGPAASDPTVRNDGSALQAGDLYFNTTDDKLKVYDGSVWESSASTSYEDSDVEAYLSGGAGIDYSNGNISHEDTSSQGSVTASSGTFISGVTLDTFGHITGLTSDTVPNAVSEVVLRAESISEIQNSSADVGNIFSLNDGGRSGIFDVVSGDFSTELAADTENGLYIGLSDDPNATTKVARRRYSGPVSIEWFGAVGDNLTDNTTAIQAALDNASFIFVPEGKFRYSSGLTKTGGSLTLVGAGQELSELVPVGSSTFEFIGGAPQEFDSLVATFSQVSWRQVGTNSGDVVKISFTGGSGSTAVSTTLQDCEITSASTTASFFTGLSLFNARNLRISKLRILGDRAGQVSENGILIDGDGDPVEFFIESSTIYFVRTGIKKRNEGEGIYINQCAIVAVTVGVDASASNNEPLFFFHNSHINSTDKNIILDNVAQYDISHNLFYGQSSDVEYLALDVKQSIGINVNSKIVNNTFVYTSTLGSIPVNAILIDASAGVSNVLVDGNTFQTFDTAVIFGPGCFGATVTDTNEYVNVTDEVSGSTANNVYAHAVFNQDNTSVTDNSGFITKSGTSVIILDSSGNGVVGFQGLDFPNEFRSGLVCNGSPNDFGDSSFIIDQNACTTSSLIFSVRPNPGAVGVRVNWVAYGR